MHRLALALLTARIEERQAMRRLYLAFATLCCALMSSNAYAQFIGGGDEVTSSLERTFTWVQRAAVTIIGIYIMVNLIHMGREGEDGAQSKKHVVAGLIALAGVMLIKPIISLIQSLTNSTFLVGF